MMGISTSLSNTPFQNQSTLPVSTSLDKNNVSVNEENGLRDSLTDLRNKSEYDLTIAEKTIIDAIERANKALTGATTNLQFSIHEKTKEIMVKVINSETQEVIREIPPEKTLDMVAKMMEMTGLFVDKKG